MQTYLRHIRDDKLLSSLPPFSLEKGRCTNLDGAYPIEPSAEGATDCGHRHSAALRRLQCMRECMCPQSTRPVQRRPAGQHDASSAAHAVVCDLCCIAMTVPLCPARLQTQCIRSFLLPWLDFAYCATVFRHPCNLRFGKKKGFERKASRHVRQQEHCKNLTC